MHTNFHKSIILRLCNQPRTFEFISKNSSGLDPIQITGILNDLEKEGLLIKKDEMWGLPEEKRLPTLEFNEKYPQNYLKKHMGHFEFLKIPHPLDFEWRNSKKSLNYLTNQMLQLSTIKDSILILGMPTLFANFCEKDVTQSVTLVERNKPIISGLGRFLNHKYKVLDADIFKISPEALDKYQCVFMDPPWYSEHFYQFVWLAARCLNIGGTLAISIPPINTRPDIDIERLNWFQFCQQQGLCLENLYANHLEYTMPFFEFNAFRAGGIENIMPFWRKGDFAIFRKVKDQFTERKHYEEKASGWEEREIDSVRIRIKPDNSGKKDFSFESIVKGDILPTVSSRDPRRDEANIWTSGNRIYKVSNPSLFLSCIDQKRSGQSLDEVARLVNSFVGEITDLEKKEYDNYLAWVYYEMERQIA
ncbi:MAG TPA: class I SAM-dependent methyltransferase [Puia sp.]|nr:class I SAM-dependent methyltransferase [Puia sp.]